MSELIQAVESMTSKYPSWDHCKVETTKFIISICEHYAEVFGLKSIDVFNALEKNRDYSYPNYYQEANQPRLEDIKVFDDETTMKQAINVEQGFRCPACKGISKHPYSCNSGIEIEVGKVCDWKSFGFFKTLGKGFRFTIKEGFLDKPVIDECFMPICMEALEQ